MTAEAAQSVLRRKAGAHEAVAPTVMDSSKAFRVAMAQTGEAALETALGVRSMDESTLLPDALSVEDPETSLILRLETAAGSRAIALLSLNVVAAVVEALTLGTVLPGDTADRRPTKTDAALVGGFLDEALVKLSGLVCDIPRHVPVDGYQANGLLEDERAAQLYLADCAHKKFRLTLDFGLGAKVGDLAFVLPTLAPKTEDVRSSADEWSNALEKAVMASQAELFAQLCKTQMSLAQIAALKPGDTVPLKEARLDNVALIAPNGKAVIAARLGRSGTSRAVRISESVAQAGSAIIENLGVAPAKPSPAMLLDARTEATKEERSIPKADLAVPEDLTLVQADNVNFE